MDSLISTMKRWLPLKEAALYSAIGRHRLIAMARDGRVKGFQDDDSGRHEWIFDRLSIDTFRENQAVQVTCREKALAILHEVRL